MQDIQRRSAEAHAAGFCGLQRSFRAGSDHFPLVLGNGRHDVQREARGMRVVACDEFDARVHHRRDKKRRYEIEVQHERINVCAQLSHEERYMVSHQPTDEMHIAAQTIQLEKQVGARTAQRYATSLKVLTPLLDGKYLDQMDGKFVAEIIRVRRSSMM